MLKSDILTEVGARLGDTTAAFIAVLDPIFNEVVRELAAHDALGTLRKKNVFRWVIGQGDYDSRSVSGLNGSTVAVPTGNDYPIDILRFVVPAWGEERGFIERLDDLSFEHRRLENTNTDGSAILFQPQFWRTYPNQTNVQFQYVPDTYSSGFDVECYFLAPPTTLNASDPIVEIRLEHMPFIIAGMVKHGLVFQDETIIDRATAIREFELGIVRMKTQNQRERGRAYRTHYRDF